MTRLPMSSISEIESHAEFIQAHKNFNKDFEYAFNAMKESYGRSDLGFLNAITKSVMDSSYLDAKAQFTNSPENPGVFEIIISSGLEKRLYELLVGLGIEGVFDHTSVGEKMKVEVNINEVHQLQDRFLNMLNKPIMDSSGAFDRSDREALVAAEFDKYQQERIEKNTQDWAYMAKENAGFLKDGATNFIEKVQKYVAPKEVTPGNP